MDSDRPGSSADVIVENGGSVASNGDVILTNGCSTVGEEDGSELSAHGHAKSWRKKQQRKLSGMDAEVIRLVGQHLREMGLHNTLDHLMEESGCALEHPKAARFRSHVISGEWEEANGSLRELAPLVEDPSNLDKMRLLLLREKYLELLECGAAVEALQCLRHELAPLPLHHSDKHLQTLTSYMMIVDKQELQRVACWPGVKGGSREKLMDELQAFLPASVMLPPKRLQQLLMQAVQLQVERCPFHYVEQDISRFSLLTDHLCSRCEFPSETVHTLTDHSDEVWHLCFSHDGRHLASGSRNGQVIIWNITCSQPLKRHVLHGQNDGIALLVWSPDDSLLLACGREDNPEIIIFSTESGEVKTRFQNSAEDSLTSCAWHRDGQKFYVGGTRGQFLECAIDGTVTASWEGIRVHAIATHPDRDVVYAADTHCRIRQYNFHEKSSSTLVQEDQPIMSFTLSRSGKHALLNVANQGVHVWDLQDRCLVRRYQGVTQGQYTIHSTYGGISDSFIASGSEDHHIYIWHTRRELPVIVLKGHSRAVNAVAWNPVQLSMLASASDDGTVHVWGTEQQMVAQRALLREGEQQKALEQAAQEALAEGTSTSRELSAHTPQERGSPLGAGPQTEPREESESEGMEVHHSEASLVSELDPQSSELERSLSSEHGISIVAEEDDRSIRTESVLVDPRTRSPAGDVGGASRQGGETAGPSSEQSGASLASGFAVGSTEFVQMALGLQESSVDPESSHTSLDSSNGSARHMASEEASQSEDFEDGASLADTSRTSSMSASEILSAPPPSAPSLAAEGSGREEGQQQPPPPQQPPQSQQPRDTGSQRSRPPQTTGGSRSTIV